MKPLYALFLAAALAARADNLYVDPANGDDAASGLSDATAFKTIAKAVKVAKPGDTIHLAKAEYHEQVFFYDKKSGEPGKPITLDGHEATINGAVPLDPKHWKEVSPGLWSAEAEDLFRNTMRPKDFKDRGWVDAVVGRFSFVFDGKLNRMNHSIKAPGVPWKKPEELKPGEWTYQEPESHLFGTYFIKIDPAKKLTDSKIELPMINSAVQIHGDVRHLVIKNLTVTHVINDGFALTVGNEPESKVRDILFENIRAVECCDDGLSAHGDCEVRVDGFEAVGCGTGIATCGTSVNTRVVTRDIHGVDLLFIFGTHVVSNSTISCHGNASPVLLQAMTTNHTCSVALENVALVGDKTGTERARTVRVDERCKLEMRRVTATDLSFTSAKDSVLAIRDSVISGGTRITVSEGGKWEADGNLYDLESLRVGQGNWTIADFEKSRAATGQDAASRWMKLEPGKLPDQSKGADPALLPAPVP